MKGGRQPHQRVFNIVEGAVYNARDSHPNWPLDHRFVKSIAKRAAGTLTATWPEVLAAPTKPSDQPGAGYGIRVPGGGISDATTRSRRGRVTPVLARSLKRLHVKVGVLAAQARYAGQSERYNALVDALRLVRLEIDENVRRSR